jgi:hypothetical protein
MKRSKPSGVFTVSGPFEQPYPVPNVGAGISLAQNFASKHRTQAETLTYRVTHLDGTLLAVVKLLDGVIYTTAHTAFTRYAA